ncbi:hypothetical protein CCACVL1_27252 [Corchorus capsularis]|uniref:Uncharacterized protein n=1 Tax=Corchorus capsularis TaxID=210143 RepID=A0A1R3GBE9_COCAP|nr:hypothetical protein CCACVL1_27252 [Corchorus capsularis]
MHKQALMGDAWIREAQEASKLVEDIENRVISQKQSNLKQQEKRVVDNIVARSKLLEAGIKLDRLESLLRNPPSKPILTNEDLDYRWKMLLDMQQRSKSLVLSLFALPTSSRPESLTPENTKEKYKIVDEYDYEQGGILQSKSQTKTSLSKDDTELFRPLISNDVMLESKVQMKTCGTSTSQSLLQKVFWIFGAVLGLAALIFILILICAVI